MIAFLIFLAFVPLFTLLGIYAERKVSAFVQDRLGPMETGPYGIFQTFADIVKLLNKEDIVPENADKFLFKTAPFFIFVPVFTAFAVIPLAPGLEGSLMANGLFFALSIVSIEVIGILMAGWASNNKFSLFGAMRSIAQMISYEVPLGLAILCVVMAVGSLDLQEISRQQGVLARNETSWLLGLSFTGISVQEPGGFLTWNIFRYPLLFFAFLIYFIASLAECNRAPFDIPEAESELVGGFHTEYSGLRWAFIFLAEYGMMMLTSMLAAILFLGSWNSLLPNMGPVRLAEWTTGQAGTAAGAIWGAFWLLSKTFTLVFFQMMARWTYPRLRMDQLMYLGWKVLTPIGLLLVVLMGAWKLVM